jgi:hypothetical protein
MRYLRQPSEGEWVHVYRNLQEETEIIKRGSRDAIHAGVLEMCGAGSLNTATEHLRIVVSEKDRAKEFPREEFYIACPARRRRKMPGKLRPQMGPSRRYRKTDGAGDLGINC